MNQQKNPSQPSNPKRSEHTEPNVSQGNVIQPHLLHSSSIKQQNPVPSVNEAKKKLDNLIEDLNDKLVQHFKMKEEALLNQYKLELVEQQKKLNELKNTTNQEQIRNKMLQRKSQLEKQRNHLIQTNMFFSQKCQQYKQTYTKLLQESKDLEKQIQFLDSQIAIANDKRLNLVDDVTSLSQTDRNVQNLELYTQKKAMLPELEQGSQKKQKSTLQKSLQTQSVRKIARSLHLSTQQKPKKSSSTKGFQKIDKIVFSKSALQRVFEQCVEQVKNRRKNKRTMPNLKGEEFTEYEKRAIMEIFLGNEEVKKKLYEIIFAEGDKNFKRGFPKEGQKTKISFDGMGV